MSTGRVSIDDLIALQRVLSSTDALLLDFDGPICSVFSQLPAHHVADQLRNALPEHAQVALPSAVRQSRDPFDVLRYAATVNESAAQQVESLLRLSEIEAVASAPPTAGSHDLMRAWHSSGRPLAIVSNNSAAAVGVYLKIHGLEKVVSLVSARASANPALLKPSAHLVNTAVGFAEVKPNRATLVGDSTSDIEAARHAGVTSIGYANKPHKVGLLSQHRAMTVVSRLTLLIEALNHR